MKSVASLAIGLLAATGLVVSAQAADYQIDSTHVHTGFRVSHLGFSHTLGQFDQISGTLSFDEGDPAVSAVDVTINTASVDTGNDERDEHLRGPDFFNVEQFPTMTFKSTNVEVTGERTANVTGDLTLLGVTRPVTLAVTLNQAGPHPRDASRQIAGFSATTQINRSDFGMGYAIPAIGDTVEITIEAEAIRQ